MKQLFIFLLLILGQQAIAQNGVTVHQDARIDYYMEKLNTTTVVVKQQPKVIYKIQLISTYDRGEANKAQAKFRSAFPGTSAYLKYDRVKYIIRVGKYGSKQEADQALMNIRKQFPSAFLLPPVIAQ